MIIIFGSSGYIGTNLINLFLKKRIRFIRPSIRKKENCVKIKNFNYLSILSLIKKFKPTTIINLHAQTDVNFSFEDPDYDFNHNIKLTISVLKSIKNFNPKISFINIGTATQVGFTNIKSKIDINYNPCPQTVFDLNKQYCEDLMNLYRTNYNLNVFQLRISNVFGPGKKVGINRGVINKIIENAYFNNTMTILGNGLFVRDFIYIDDVINAIFLSYKFRKKLTSSYYYITSNKGHSFLDLFNFLRKILMKKYSKNLILKKNNWPKKTKKIDKRSFVGNNLTFCSITNWKPEVSLEKNIEKYLNKLSRQN